MKNSKDECSISTKGNRYSFSPLGVMIEVTNDNKILNRSAHQNPSTLNPGTNLLPSRMINAFITNKKRPSVRIVMGSVSKISIGFSNVFRMANTKASIIAVQGVSICIPFKI